MKILIAAHTVDRVMGDSVTNSLPWPKLKEDMEFFKRKTLGSCMIMGRKTAQSLGKPLPGRKNIVLGNVPGFHCAKNMFSAMELVNTPDVYIIGGASVYPQFDYDLAYITEINDSYDGDIIFPLDFSNWRSEVIEVWHFGRALKYAK